MTFKSFLLISFLLLIGCDQHKPKNQFIVPDKNDINNIVSEIVKEESLTKDTIPFCVDLQKVILYIPSKGKALIIPPPSNLYKLDIEELIGFGTQKGYFAKKDSSYLLFQNTVIKNFKIDTKFITNIRLTTSPIQDSKRKSGKYYSYYFELTIPIFSTDHKTAYVLFSRFCPLCGSGGEIILKKLNDKWVITNKIDTWES